MPSRLDESERSLKVREKLLAAGMSVGSQESSNRLVYAARLLLLREFNQDATCVASKALVHVLSPTWSDSERCTCAGCMEKPV
eukprot:756995-Hanusia_phi.AAC.3